MSVSENQAWTEFKAQPNENNFEAVYRATSPLVYTICRRILRNEEDTLDAFQSAYARILEMARAGKGGDEDMISVVRTMTVREADSLRHRRRRKQARETVDESIALAPDPSPGAVENLSRVERQGMVESTIAKLGDDDRIPIQLHYFHGMTLREIADGLNKPLTTVSSRISRALRKLDPMLRSAGLGEVGAIVGGAGIGAELLAPPASVSAATVYAFALAAPAKTATATLIAAKFSYLAAALTTKSGAFAVGTAFGAIIILALAFSSNRDSKPQSADVSVIARIETGRNAGREIAQTPVTGANDPRTETPPASASGGKRASTTANPTNAQANPPTAAGRSSRESGVLPAVVASQGATPTVEPPEVGILFSQWSAERTNYNDGKYEGWGAGYYAQQYVVIGLRMAGLKPYAIIEPGTLESGALAQNLEKLKLTDRVLDGSNVEDLRKLDVILAGFSPNIVDEVVEAIMSAVEAGSGFVNIAEFGIEHPGNTQELRDFLGLDRSEENFRQYDQNMTLETVAPQEFRVGAATMFIEGYPVSSVRGYHGVVDGTPLLLVPETIDDAFCPVYIREHGKGRMAVIQCLIAPGGYGSANSATPSMDIMAVRNVVQYVANWASHRPIMAEWKKSAPITTTLAADTPTTPTAPAKIGVLLSKVNEPRTNWYEFTDKHYPSQLGTFIAGLETMGADIYPILEPEATANVDTALSSMSYGDYFEKVIHGDDVEALARLDLIISFANPKVSTDVLKAIHSAVQDGAHLAVIGELGADQSEGQPIAGDLLGFEKTEGPQVLGASDGRLIHGLRGRTVENSTWSADVIRDTQVALDGTSGYIGAPNDATPLIILEQDSGQIFWPAYVRSVGSGDVIVCQFIRIYTGGSKFESMDTVQTYEDMYGWIVRLVESAKK